MSGPVQEIDPERVTARMFHLRLGRLGWARRETVTVRGWRLVAGRLWWRGGDPKVRR